MQQALSMVQPETRSFIPIFRPILPNTAALLPYLEQIDQKRWYTNFGPLNQLFEQRLEKHFGTGRGTVRTVANGTIAITLALLAQEAPRGSLCIMPSWTFTATPAAALAAGLTPCFMDVDETTLALDPRQVKELMGRAPGKVGAVVVVAPFGAPIDIQAWEDFHHTTGVAVVIDAAAAFDTLATSPLMKIHDIPVTVSMHATKALGVGEGGCVISRNTGVMYKLWRLTVFGFDGERRAEYLGTNAKLNEYAAAVGLAGMDQWQQTRSNWDRVRSLYMRHLSTSDIRCWADKSWVTNTINVLLSGNAVEVGEALAKQGVDSRRWWREGCHRQPAYVHFPKLNNMTVTDRLASSVLGLPCAVDLEEEEISRVCTALQDVLAHV